MSRYTPDSNGPLVLLDPPVTPKERFPLKADENYQYMVSDAEVDRRARTEPHGHVTPREDGGFAKCGGPNGPCGVCRREQEILDWTNATPTDKMDRVLAHLRTTREYTAIAAHYGDRTAKRSKVPYIEHIDQGLAVLITIGAPVEAMLAYCLHPLAQGDDDLASFDPAMASTPTVLMYVMEYRNVANRYLSFHYGQESRSARLSPLPAVNQMLIADKVQNRKDFETYHSHTYPNHHLLRFYFVEWLTALGVDRPEYVRLAAVCAAVEGHHV